VTVFTSIVLFLRLGSFEDRIVVGVLWLSLALLPMARYARNVARLIGRYEPLRYILLSSIGLIWAWANARFRGGGGPFHLHLAGIWRGYPLPFEEWWWSQGGLSEITWHREFHLPGFICDVLIPAAAFHFVLRWLWRSRATVDGIRTLLFVGFTTAFTWLNIEPWLGGLPLSIVGPPPPFRPLAYFYGDLTLGFPLIFWNGFTSEPQFRWIAANVVIGLSAWAGLYWARYVAQRIDSRTEFIQRD
jgi:hypothetical protein